MKKNWSIFIGIIALAVIVLFGIAYVASSNLRTNHDPEEEVHTLSGDLDLAGLTEGGAVQKDGYTIERLLDAPQETITVPFLDRTIPAASPHLDESVYEQVVENLGFITTSLKEDSDNFNTWLNLATYRTVLSDYAGAEEVLVYLTKQYTPSWQVYANLGNLYDTYLPNGNKAEENYKRAIELLPNNSALYRSLFDVYSKQGRQDEAVVILKDGIENEPRAIDLYVVLARYLNQNGDAPSAVSYYETALLQADAQGNTEAKNDIQEELDAL